MDHVKNNGINAMTVYKWKYFYILVGVYVVMIVSQFN